MNTQQRVVHTYKIQEAIDAHIAAEAGAEVFNHITMSDEAGSREYVRLTDGRKIEYNAEQYDLLRVAEQFEETGIGSPPPIPYMGEQVSAAFPARATAVSISKATEELVSHSI